MESQILIGEALVFRHSRDNRADRLDGSDVPVVCSLCKNVRGAGAVWAIITRGILLFTAEIFAVDDMFSLIE
jgi:hypothetical protein